MSVCQKYVVAERAFFMTFLAVFVGERDKKHFSRKVKAILVQKKLKKRLCTSLTPKLL